MPPDWFRSLSARLGARATVHERFGTATLELPGGSRMDIATTRRETYAYPGALPEVSSGASLAEDLLRRDFSIHAMALDVSRRSAALVDPCGGTQDLAARRIRFLHPASPVDDPTRAFRAVRYAIRLGFSISRPAREQIASAIERGAFDAVSGARLRRELVLLFAEPRRALAVSLLLRLGLDRAIAPGLARSAAGAAERIRAAERLAAARRDAGWLCYLLAWMGPARTPALRELAARLALSGRESLAVSRWAVTRRRLAPGFARLAPSRRRGRIAGLSPEEILAAAALLSGADRRALSKLAGGEAAALGISGADLIARGSRPVRRSAGPSPPRAPRARTAASAPARSSSLRWRGPGAGGIRDRGYRSRGRSRRRVAADAVAHSHSRPHVLRGVGPPVERGL